MKLCILFLLVMAEQERNDFVRSIRLSLLDLARRIEHASSADQVEYVIVRLRQITQHLLSSMLSEVEQQQQQQSQRNIVAAEGSEYCRSEISAEQLEYLFGYDLTFRDVAEALGVSESTVKRRAREHGISVRDRRSNMTDHELDEVLRQIKTEFSNAGYCRVHSQLVSRGIRYP